MKVKNIKKGIQIYKDKQKKFEGAKRRDEEVRKREEEDRIKDEEERRRQEEESIRRDREIQEWKENLENKNNNEIINSTKIYENYAYDNSYSMHNPSFATYPQVNPVYNNIQN